MTQEPNIPQLPEMQSNQPNQPQPKCLKIDTKLIEAVLNTLGQLPYRQIEPLITELRNDLAKNNQLQ